MRDGVCQLLARLNGDGDVLVGRLQDVLLLGESAHGKHEERREEEFFHDDIVFMMAKIEKKAMLQNTEIIMATKINKTMSKTKNPPVD